jgi:hypothetical protein
MKKLAVLAGLALTMGLGAFGGAAYAPTVQPYQQAAFDVSRKSGEPHPDLRRGVVMAHSSANLGK